MATPNTKQAAAINAALAANDHMFITDPAGTGKTFTITEIIKGLQKQNLKVVVCAPTNKAAGVIGANFRAAGINVPVLSERLSDWDTKARLLYVALTRAQRDAHVFVGRAA